MKISFSIASFSQLCISDNSIKINLLCLGITQDDVESMGLYSTPMAELHFLF